MPLENLIERILKDARDQAEQIKNEASIGRLDLLVEANGQAEDVYRRTFEKARLAAEREKKQKVTMAALEARKSVLEEKQKVLQEVFDSAVRELQNLPDSEYAGLMVRGIVDAAGGVGGELILSARDRDRLGERIVSEVNDTLKREGRSARISLSEETRDISGGFIMRSGGVEVNSSLESQLSSRREEIEPRLVRLLFTELEPE